MLKMIINALVKPKQHILIPEIPKGNVLDIGGGGEGVIAQAGGTRVFAIDKFMSEIREARNKAPDAAWIVADATELPYSPDCIDNATAFFSCMYMPEDVKRKVFQETRRVLVNGGEFWIWDVNMPLKGDVFAFRLQGELPDKRLVKTVYGVRNKKQTVDLICEMLQNEGFEVEVITNHKYWFMIKAVKIG
jgi:ubiquinone/menaquinone biosynthesis C-methylase UbiE